MSEVCLTINIFIHNEKLIRYPYLFKLYMCYYKLCCVIAFHEYITNIDFPLCIFSLEYSIISFKRPNSNTFANRPHLLEVWNSNLYNQQVIKPLPCLAHTHPRLTA